MLDLAVTPVAALFHGGATVPLIWIIGLVLIVGGLISMVRGGIAAGIILVILGIILGGLQLL
ncbi:MAG: hypothetical protein ACRD0Z_12375 [Acidimicrobiales bacterium]